MMSGYGPGASAPIVGPVRGKPRGVLIAVGIAALTVAAGSLAGYLYVQQRSGRSSAVVDDGPTFYEALSQLNTSVQGTPGGPWTLYTAYGVAAPVPFSPSALGWNRQNLTVNSCGAQFGGLTLWNGSIPLFNGTYNSGTAPFWQFMYFSNATQRILVATDVVGQPHVYPPILMLSPCMTGSSLANEPWAWARVLNPLPADSPTLARTAVERLGANWFAGNQPVTETYRFGNNYWGSGNPGGLVMNFERCGETGEAGVQPKSSVVMNESGAFVTSFVGAQGCGNVYTLGPPPVILPYQFAFLSPSTLLSGGGGYTTIAFQAAVEAVSNGTLGGWYPDAHGIVSWMSRLSLVNATGTPLPSAKPTCPEWVPAIGDGAAESAGWFVVLLSRDGGWLDAYGVSAGGANWSLPNVAVVSNQQMVVVCPSTWDVAGYTLAANSTTPSVILSGSVSL